MDSGPLILDLQGKSLTDAERRLLMAPCVGGVILFSRNIGAYDQLVQLTADIREVRSDLLICVDQEGGRVQRCREGFTRIPPMQIFAQLYKTDARDALIRAGDCGWLLASEVLAAGIDFSFTPVLDVDDNYCSVIGDRAFSDDPDIVTELSKAFIAGAHEAGMKVTGKHFPGHGSVVGDSHLELPVDSRPWADIRDSDLIPFSDQAVGEGALDAVMPAHILFPEVDAEQPVGFSKVWLQDILRGKLKFDGIVFSDDLTMEGAAVAGSYTDRARLALEAGCDVILVCNNREGAEEVINALSCDGELNPSRRALSRMRPEKALSHQQLVAHPRWLDTSQWLSKFN